MVTLSGCTLGFDPNEVRFETSAEPDTGTTPDMVVTPRDMGTDQAQPDPDLPPADVPEDEGEDQASDVIVEGLGQVCGIDRDGLCAPGTVNWPDCAAQNCKRSMGPDAVCIRNNDGLFGYCSQPCVLESQCEGDPQDEFAASMRCVSESDGLAFCKPGSQNPCLQDASCPAGEVCKRTLESSNTKPAQVCQTATPLGAPNGVLCNDDPRLGLGGYIQRCANDACIYDTCAALCDPEAPDADDTCADPNLICRRVQEVVPNEENDPSWGRCLPKPCLSPEQCDAPIEEGPYCSILFEESNPDQIHHGQCYRDNPQSQGNLGLGEDCTGAREDSDPARCASRLCVGRDPYYTCSAFCDSDDDCASSQLCTLGQRRIEGEVYYFKACQYAKGSQQICADDLVQCEEGEACAPYLRGDLTEDGQRVLNASVEGRCVEPIPGGVAQQTSCDSRACGVPGACVGEPAECTHVCTNSLQCVFGQICVPVSWLSAEDHEGGDALTLGFCVSL